MDYNIRWLYRYYFADEIKDLKACKFLGHLRIEYKKQKNVSEEPPFDFSANIYEHFYFNIKKSNEG